MTKIHNKYNLECPDYAVAAIEGLWVRMDLVLTAANEAQVYAHKQRRKPRGREPVVR